MAGPGNAGALPRAAQHLGNFSSSHALPAAKNAASSESCTHPWFVDTQVLALSSGSLMRLLRKVTQYTQIISW